MADLASGGCVAGGWTVPLSLAVRTDYYFRFLSYSPGAIVDGPQVKRPFFFDTNIFEDTKPAILYV